MNQNSSQLFFHGFSKSKLVNCRCHSRAKSFPHSSPRSCATQIKSIGEEMQSSCQSDCRHPTAGSRPDPARHSSPSFQHPQPPLHTPSHEEALCRCIEVQHFAEIHFTNKSARELARNWRIWLLYSELGLPRILFSCKLHKSDKSDLGSKPSSSRVTTFLRLFFNTF